jgi:hypothetical protein
MIITKFDMTQEHLDLLKHMNVWFNDTMYMGAPAVDIKRPFGNKSVYEDMARILKLEMTQDQYGDDILTKEHTEYLEKLWPMMEIALQIVLCTQSFKTGHYVKAEEYSYGSWMLNEV